MGIEKNKKLESIEIPQGKGFFEVEHNGETVSGLYPLEVLLFGGDLDGYRHEGYIPYIAGKTQDFATNIESEPMRYQGLVNCLSKGLVPYGQNKSHTQLQDNFTQFIKDLEFLYGYLGDLPELLEKKGRRKDKGKMVPQNITLQKLLQISKNKVEEKRNYQRGILYKETLLEILESATLEDKTLEYIETSYRNGGSPKKEELEKLGVSSELIQGIIEEGDFRRIQAIVVGEETLIGEQDGYQLVEMHSIEHLEKETEITDHCVGESDHYINKMNKQEIRMFSLRKGGERITCEYDIRENRLIQMQGSNKRFIQLSELDILLPILATTEIGESSFRYQEVQELQEKEHFLIQYQNDENSLSIKDYSAKELSEEHATIGGMVECSSETTEKELQELCRLNIDLDITNLSQELKNTIQYVKGNIKDNSDFIQMNNLQSVGENINCINAKEIKLNSLQSIRGSLHCYSATKIQMNNLQSIGEGFWCNNAKEIHMNALQSVGGTFYCRNATEIHMNKLQSVGEVFRCNNAMTGDTSQLHDCEQLTLKKGSQVQLPETVDFPIEYV